VFVIDINTETFFWLAQMAPFITVKHPIYHLLDWVFLISFFVNLWSLIGWMLRLGLK